MKDYKKSVKIIGKRKGVCVWCMFGKGIKSSPLVWY